MSSAHPNARVAPPGTYFRVVDNTHLDTSHFMVGNHTPHLFSFDLVCTKGIKYTYTYKRQAGFDFNRKDHIKHADLWKFQILNRTQILPKAPRSVWTPTEISIIRSHPSYKRRKLTNSAVKQLVLKLPGRSGIAVRARVASMKSVELRSGAFSEADADEDEQSGDDEEGSEYGTDVPKRTSSSQAIAGTEVKIQELVPGLTDRLLRSGKSFGTESEDFSYSNNTISDPISSPPTIKSPPKQEIHDRDYWIEAAPPTGPTCISEYPENPQNPDKNYWTWVGYPR